MEARAFFRRFAALAGIGLLAWTTGLATFLLPHRADAHTLAMLVAAPTGRTHGLSSSRAFPAHAHGESRTRAAAPAQSQTGAHGPHEARAVELGDVFFAAGTPESLRAVLEHWQELDKSPASARPGLDTADIAFAMTLDALLLADAVARPSEQVLEALGQERATTTDAWLERAATSARASGDVEFQANVAWRRGARSKALGRFAEARSVLETAERELAAARGMLPWIQAELASLALHRGETKEAEMLLARAAIRLVPGAPYAEHAAVCLKGVRAQLLLALGLPDVAAPLVAEELASAQALGDIALYQAALLHSANLKLAIEDFTGVEELVQGVRNEAWMATSPAVLAELDLALGLAETELERADPRRERKAATTLARVVSAEDLWEVDRLSAELALADVELSAGDHARARTTLASARTRSERLLTADAHGVARTDLAWLAALEGRLARRSNADTDALHAALDRLETAYAGFLDEWAATPEREGGLGFLRYGARRRAVLSELTELLIAVHGPDRGAEEALVRLVAGQSLGALAQKLALQVPPDTAALVAPNAPDRIGRARELLAKRGRLLWDGTRALVYLPSSEASHLLVVDETDTTHHRLPPALEIERARRAFVTAVQTKPWTLSDRKERARNRAEIDVTGAALAEMLLPPAARLDSKLLPVESVVVAGLDLLGYVPFEALPLPGGGLIGDRVDLYYLPSIPVGVLLAERDLDDAWAPELALFLLPELSERARARFPTLERLDVPRSRSEDLLGGWSEDLTVVREGSEATRAAFLEIWERRPLLLHVFTHGIYDSERELPTGFLVAESGDDAGFFWSSDLPSTGAPPHVILSACGVGRGYLRHGDDGLGSFSGRLLAAGAMNVVVSPIDLEADATARLMARFVELQLEIGVSPSLALCWARAELAREDGLDAPYYRSLVHLVGLGHRGVIPGPPTICGHEANALSAAQSLAMLLGGLALIALAVFFILRARRRALGRRDALVVVVGRMRSLVQRRRAARSR